MPSCASTRRSSEMRAPMAAIESSLQRLKSAIRSRGTLRTWAMTSTGSGTAKSATSSISPAPIQPSISRSTIATTGSRSAAIDLGVKWGATVAR